MAHFASLDVSVKEASVCVVADAGKVVCEPKMPTEPDDIAVLLTSVGGDYARVGIEAGPLWQWLVNGLSEAVLPVICVDIAAVREPDGEVLRGKTGGLQTRNGAG